MTLDSGKEPPSFILPVFANAPVLQTMNFLQIFFLTVVFFRFLMYDINR